MQCITVRVFYSDSFRLAASPNYVGHLTVYTLNWQASANVTRTKYIQYKNTNLTLRIYKT